MNMAINTFKQGLLAGKPQIGLWISLCSPFAADVVSCAGFDWTLLDMEHSPNEMPTVLGQLQAMQQGTTTPLVRPVWNDPLLVKRLLDLGAPGLLFPMIQSVAEAQQAVASTRYPPNGFRGVSLAQRGNRFGRTSDYFDQVEAQTCILIQLETQHALKQAKAIANVDGVDGIFFGPADISADSGHLGTVNDPSVWDDIMATAEVVRGEGKAVGTLVGDAQKAIDLIENGFTFVACGSDLGLLARGSDALLSTVRQGIS